MPINIHCIRHTTPNIKQGICYGRSDIGLTNNFNHEAKTIIAKLQQQTNQAQYNIIYSSPSKRCLQLAERIEQIQAVTFKKQNTVTIDHRLQEVDFGDWELRAWDDIPRQESQAWMEDFINIAPPNGESLICMKKRVDLFFNNLSKQTRSNENISIAIITHAGVMRLMTSLCLKIPLEEIFSLKLNYGQIIELNSIHDHYSLRFIS